MSAPLAPAIGVSALSRRLVRRRAEAEMTSVVTILRGQLGAFDPLTGRLGGLSNPVTIYAGKAKVGLSSDGAPISPGGGPLDQRTQRVSIPISAPVPRKDDLLIVGEDEVDPDQVLNEADPDLDQRTWRVASVDGGGMFGATRKLTCTGIFPSRNWAGRQ